jgi:hypothetical protein
MELMVTFRLAANRSLHFITTCLVCVYNESMDKVNQKGKFAGFRNKKGQFFILLMMSKGFQNFSNVADLGE